MASVVLSTTRSPTRALRASSVLSSSAASLVPDSIFRLLSLRLREAEPEDSTAPLVCVCAKADPAQIAVSIIVNISFLIKIPLSFLIKRRVKSRNRKESGCR
jgi:hypothetical protein